ncbi:MAG: HNH endonuclease signature motif containing protein [Candidatus Obscuribacterales bacterium]
MMIVLSWPPAALSPNARKLASKAKWRAANKEKIKASSAKYYLDNKARIDAANAAWTLKNPKWKANNYAANKEKIKIRDAIYYENNKEKIRIRSAQWRDKNKEKIKIKSKIYRSANPLALRTLEHSRRAREKNAIGKLSVGITEKLFKLQKGKCACCGKPLGDDYHLDHRMPLALGGSNEDWNMQLLRKRCNLQKKDKHPIKFMQERGFLL